MKNSIYDLNVKRVDGSNQSLSEYQGKVLLIFNSATKCGFTVQYDAIEALHEKYHGQGLEVLDFPSNQFMNQAPGTSEQIATYCRLTFNTKFETFQKIDVNGKDQSPLFAFLKAAQPQDFPLRKRSFIQKLFRKKEDISWNFTKFLVDRQGHVVKRYAPRVTPEEMEANIAQLLLK